MSRTVRQFDSARVSRQTATMLRWLVWGAIFAMLAVMIYQASVSGTDKNADLLAKISAPLPEAKRPRLAIDREKLEAIQDNTPFRSAEKDAWFHLMELLRSTPDEELRLASRGPVTWLQLSNQPEVYRGEPISFLGRVRRVVQRPVPKNDLGFKNYYQLWLQSHDEPDRPIVIYCLELPKGFPIELTMDEPVIFTGLFFKRWVHQGQKDIEVTPLVLARSIEWFPRPKVVEKPLGVTTLVIVVTVSLLISAILVFFWHLRTRRLKRLDLPESIVISEKLVEVQELGDDEDEVDGEGKKE